MSKDIKHEFNKLFSSNNYHFPIIILRKDFIL